MMKYLLKTMISMLIIFILPLTITSTIGSDFGQDAIHAVPVSGNALAVSGIMNNAAPSYTGTSGKEGMRGLWVASVVNIDYPSKPTADPEYSQNGYERRISAGAANSRRFL